MRDVLFIAHCTPYPPDKGEKIRSFHILQHLAQTARIHLGCLTTSPEDVASLEALRPLCASIAGFPIDKRRQKIAALLRARPGRPLMLDYYRNAQLRAWVGRTLATTPIGLAYVYSVAMLPYLDHVPPAGAVILDAIDIDSEKWTAYAQTAAFPMRLVWAREGRTLLAYERQAAQTADATLFVSPQEAARFAELAPEAASRIHAVENGVDLVRFNPADPYASPFGGRAGPHLVFTGHMDYWPNIDAATWFATHVMPGLRAVRPGIEFHIVGANPASGIRALANQPGVHVTGRVPDVRPYMAHANAAVAPLRIARGIQNKVLEAMAMARPVIASSAAIEGIRAAPGRDVLVADGVDATMAAIQSVLDGHHPGLGAAGRHAVEASYAWPATLVRLDSIVNALPGTCVTAGANCDRGVL